MIVDDKIFPLSPKFVDFLKDNKSQFDFLEGTTRAGKTTVGAVKFLLKVAQSDKRQHIISGLDNGTIEKNLIESEMGLMDIFGDNKPWSARILEYFPGGTKEVGHSHLKLHVGENESRIIYIIGYGDKSKWKRALGGQYGCIMIDEINIADMNYVREVSIRCDYLLGTLNPDDPELPVYKEFINRSRPVEKYSKDAPVEIMRELNQEPIDGWVHWFFDFDHNASLTKAEIERVKSNAPAGTKIYMNKILGLRGRAEGLIFSNFTYDGNVITQADAMGMNFETFSLGVDTSYSSQSEDTVSFMFIGITKDGTLVVLDEEVDNNKTTNKPFAPSDIANRLLDFAEMCRKKWKADYRQIYVDSADQATLMELRKVSKQRPNIYQFNNSDKRVKIVDRINYQLGWIENKKYLVVNTCNTHIHELNNYSWDGDKPEDRNDHTINAVQYAFIPYIPSIGYQQKERDLVGTARAIKNIGL